jgi:hypothetical protein
VVQVFFEPLFERPGVPTPKRQLVDFQRVNVQAGDTRHVLFTVSTAQLELVALNGSRVSCPGSYNIVFTNGVNATATVTVEVVQ